MLNSTAKITTLVALSALGAALFVAGCSKNNSYIFTQPENPIAYPIHTYTATATSVNDIDALNHATNAAARFCGTADENAEVLGHHVKHQGLTSAEKGVAHQAHALLNTPQVAPSAREYRVVLKFRCKTAPKKAL